MQVLYHHITVGRRSKHMLYEQDFCPDPTDKLVAEHDLLTAIVHRAYMDLQLKASLDRHKVKAARIWIIDPSAKPWSFLWVCNQIDLSDSLIRHIQKTAFESLV